MSTITFCPLCSKWARSSFVSKLNRINLSIVLSLVFFLGSFWTDHWIVACVPMGTSYGFDLYHQDFRLQSYIAAADHSHQICLSMGLAKGRLSLPHIPTSATYIGYQHPMIYILSWLMVFSCISLHCCALLSFTLLLPEKLDVEIKKRKAVLSFILLSFLLQFFAVTLFTIYKENKSMGADQRDVMKYLLNEYSGTYSYSYFCACTSVLISFIALIFSAASYRVYWQKLIFIKRNTVLV